MLRYTLLLCFLFLFGCGTPLSTNITPPAVNNSINSKIFTDISYTKVWKATVDSVASSFFTLENIEKDSGIMTFSFSAQQPSDYIDCGTVTMSFTEFGKKYEETFDGAAAYVNIWGARPRSFTLTGKANILVRELEKNKIEVTITTRYIGTIEQQWIEYIAAGFNTVPTARNSTETITFTDNQLGRGRDGLQCRSRMQLEQLILDGIVKKLYM